MKFTKKYFRIHSKRAFRFFLKSIHIYTYYLLTLVILCGISLSIYNVWTQHNYLKQSTFTAWREQQKKSLGRFLANEPEVCSKTYDLDNITEQVKKLEASYETGQIVTGFWHGINLEKLPSIQAQLLTEYEHAIGNQKSALNFENCQDVICVFNQVYEDHDPTIGAMIYYWYLKTGTMLSLSNVLPNQETIYPGIYSGQEYKMDEYLFTRNEIRKFYQLAMSLPENFLNIPLIKSFHKIPFTAPLSPSIYPNGCSLSTPRGEILFTTACLQQEDFFLSATHEIAKFIDIINGKIEKNNSVSSSETWKDLSLWIREDYWDKNNMQYQFHWITNLLPEQHVSQKSVVSPSEQFAELLAYYRFRPEIFSQRMPKDISHYIKTHFFKGKSYNLDGLLTQYLNTSTKQWDQQENKVWERCLNQHKMVEATQLKNLRNIASSINNPLFSCVEQEVENFLSETADNLKRNNSEACDFFTSSDYSFFSQQYFSSLEKYSKEKITQRKLEFKEFGEQVILAQKVKEQFKSDFDPTTIYVNCYQQSNAKKCYENSLRKLAASTVKQFKDIKGFYKNKLRDELTSLYPYKDVLDETMLMVKKFLNPFNYKVQFKAQKLWDECKTSSDNYSSKLNLPLKFSGGRNYLKTTFLNCINDNFQDKLDEVVDFEIYQVIKDKKVKYSLSKPEKDFALEFLEMRFKNALSQLLEEQKLLEVNYLVAYFKDIENKALERLEHTNSLYQEIYTEEHVQDQCLDELSELYPKHYFYFSKKELHQSHGRKICSTFMSNPATERKIKIAIARSWEHNKDFVDESFMSEYKTAVGICRESYPLNKKGNTSNARMLKICLEQAYSASYSEAMEKWKRQNNHHYFVSKEPEIIQSFQDRRKDLIEQAWDGKIQTGKFYFIKKWF